ncbi:MAG: hypothetical protein HY079_01455 [Elusimicrobia bacterium]|nr:hypothetical protein [Elusimicrobiota bacterium]
MRRALLLALAACVLSACVAETVERRKPRKGPVKEVGFVDFGGGHVRYSAEGWPLIVASRRRLARRLMARNCGRDLEPRVLDEYARMDADAKYSEEDISATLARGDEHFVLEKYVHISYDCRPRGWVEPVPSTATVRAPVVVVPVSTETVSVPLSTAAVTVPVSTAAPSVPLSTSTMPSPEPPR